LATLASGRSGTGLIRGGALAIVDGRIAFVGREEDLPSRFQADEEIDLAGRLVTPGLIDCHTHLVFGGDRSNEFEARLAGADYEAIAKAGGGIQSTVRATRAETEESLVASAAKRLNSFICEGVTTIEIKSGYGLDYETELRMLRAARRLGQIYPIDIVTTLLAAHTVPGDQERATYLNLVTEKIIPRAVEDGLADAIDGFCDSIGFSSEELQRVFRRARELALPVKVHADQLSDAGGAELAAQFSALSADHLEKTGAAGVAALARAGTVAVLLPGAYFDLREKHLPPIEQMRTMGVRIAIATDCNPGSSPLVSILTAMRMAAVQFSLSVDEVLAGVTREAARALGRHAETGALEVGKSANLAIWNVERPVELVYWMGSNPLFSRVWRGKKTSLTGSIDWGWRASNAP
jgi:imidazolonepropionase